MEATVEQPPAAWQPFTGTGVAAFALAPARRLFLLQCVVALASASVIAWLFGTAIFPVITEAIRQMPADGEIRNGTLIWNGDSPKVLAQNRFLALAVDLRLSGDMRSQANLAVHFGSGAIKIYFLLFESQFRYPAKYVFYFNHTDLEPLWGAWKPALLAGTFGVTFAALPLVWWVLSVLYAGPVRLLGSLFRKELTLTGAWRLSGAALTPGALLMCVAIVLHGIGVFGMRELAAASAVHFVVSFLYCLAGAIFLPPRKKERRKSRNPFTQASPESQAKH